MFEVSKHLYEINDKDKSANLPASAASDMASVAPILKELYTSETTLAQKIVLTPLNNDF